MKLPKINAHRSLTIGSGLSQNINNRGIKNAAAISMAMLDPGTCECENGRVVRAKDCIVATCYGDGGNLCTCSPYGASNP